MSREHAPQHDEICTRGESLRDITRRGAATVSHHMSQQTMRGVGALRNGGQLRVAHTSHLPGRADRTRTDTDFHYVCTGEDEGLGHLSGGYITGDDDLTRKLVANPLDEIKKNLAISVGDVYTDYLDAVIGRHLAT